MHSSRFQLGLMATLAVGLGFSLASSNAIGYPAGAAVSTGYNPVFSAAGELVGPSDEALVTVPPEQALIITDVILSSGNAGSNCVSNTVISIEVDGVDYGRFAVGVTFDTRSYSNWDPQLVANLQSGIRIPPGSAVRIHSSPRYQWACDSSALNVDYTLSGYYAQL